MDAFLKLYMPVFFIVFIVLVFIAPSVRVYKKTGINPFRFATSHNPIHDYVGNSMKVFIVLLFIPIILFALSPTAYRYLAPFDYLNLEILKIIGLLMAHLSLTGIMIAQNQMRLSWRIGIDYEHRTELITSGLFSRSRNPIYLFLLFGLIGMFLLLPNAITLSVMFAAYLVLNITMRMEEDFLTIQHGQVYLNYKKKVGRLV